MKRSPPPRRYDRRRRPYWTDFECPVCSAENPRDDGFTFGEELVCFYCQSVCRVVPVEGSEPPRYHLDGV